MDFDAIVIGGGHAGIEASLALARLEKETLLITQNLDCIGKMSCNPAIGGLAKGNLVREIDALGGEIARLIDATMIQFRMLNKSKGPAVQAPRAQADKASYSLLAKRTLERQKHLEIFQDTVTDLLTDSAGRTIRGVVTERGRRFTAKAVVLTTGTFMEGVIYIGSFSCSSGRLGEPAAIGLGGALQEKGFSVGRLKTGTPARVLRDSLDYKKMSGQAGDTRIQPFSFSNESITRPDVPCYITYTTEKTHEIIRKNIHLSPLFSGKIRGVGPRYCPSIEDKVMRFPDRSRHQIFVEPEGLDTEEMYLNGISSSLPETVQEEFLRTVPGFEHLVIMRPGYAVEYDYLNPQQLYPSLQTKRIKGLFIAGQTNGTSGYEEAAAQGLVAGINAFLSMENKEPLILSRSEAYIGVLIDDLVTLGTDEPYRLFTSRAEYRLSLRHDTADIRLLEKGYTIGLKSREAYDNLQLKLKHLEEVKELLRKRRIREEDIAKTPSFEKHLGKNLEALLRDPAIHMNDLKEIEQALSHHDEGILVHTELDVKYEGYIKRQEEQVKRFQKMESMKIPPDFDFESITGLSKEAREKFIAVRPVSVGQASRISGVRYSDITILLFYLKKSGTLKKTGAQRGTDTLTEA
ncbi:MAG: tRNA uridine-5-carboxymethylaminomethyl(34) synthesis enzyme MnmG [Spirochaetales bacterium]|nr:tRNA uridine-5-carboxymethylaminomethyl(34) synthesis enzyme MnmG [Spirochaetales bacterium]